LTFSPGSLKFRTALAILILSAAFFATISIDMLVAVFSQHESVGRVDFFFVGRGGISIGFSITEENQHTSHFTNIAIFSAMNIRRGDMVEVLKGWIYAYVKKMIPEMLAICIIGFSFLSVLVILSWYFRLKNNRQRKRT